MDNSKNNSADFLLLLQKQSFKKPSVLYNQVLNTNEQSYKPQDVIKTVYSQIKAIHLADCTKSEKKDINKAHKSHFLPVNKLPMYSSNMQQAHIKDPNKFETQCVSDTQLINIIDCAEALDSNTGMTQEFDITFTHIEDRNNDNLRIDKVNESSLELFNDVDSKHEEVSVLKENQLIVIKRSQSEEDIIVTKATKLNITETNILDGNSHKSAKIEGNIPNITKDLTPDINTQLTNTDAEDTVTFIQNVLNTQEEDELKEIYNTEEIDIDTGQDKHRSPSPVLNMNTRKRKMKTPSPLVVSLESFENFENIAIPLIEENTDFETAKHLINSQILGKELCLNTKADIMCDVERNYSPVFDFKSDELQINSQDLKTLPVKKVLSSIALLCDTKDITYKCTDSLKDEILFSSDEENDYIQKDLPLTCALETSFYDQPDILEKTMYVGFQTASNKSIQICKESFEEAHSILEGDNRTIEDLRSLSALVEKVDTLNSKREKSVNSTANTAQANETGKTIAVESEADLGQNEDNLEKVVEKEIIENSKCENIEEHPPGKRKFNGFMTANNKEIKMSKNSLERCHKIFKDIDLNENFDAVETAENAGSIVENVTCLNDTVKKPFSIKNLDENIIDDQINDELLLQEFENIEMSLEEKETNNKVEQESLESFKTANNNPIKISKEALEKTNKVFQDIIAEMDEHNNNTDAVMKLPVKEISSVFKKQSITSKKLIGFKTASHKNINISAQAYAKTRNIFQEIEIENAVDTIEDINQPSTSKAVFVGFKTANNMEIKISDEALSNTKDIFNDLGREKPKIKAIENIKQQSTSETAFLGFKTANNKNIKISEEALSKTRNVFKDIDDKTPKIETVKNINQLSTNKAVFEGFKTVNKKNIEISEDDLPKYKNIFNDINDEILSKSGVEKKEISSKGFQTASNKRVTVSGEAFIKSRNLFRDLDINDSNNTKTIFDDIKTPNNKSVNESVEALVKDKILLADFNANNADSKIPSYAKDDKDENLMQTEFKGFQTASQKPVTVSADAMARSKRIFQDTDEIKESIPEKIPKIISNIGFKGFQTANRVPVEVSKVAVIASKKLIDDFNDIKTENSENIFVGFKTASNKHVAISKDALDKCKKIFDGIEDIPATAKNSSKSHEHNKDIFNVFQTANNEKVNISREALKQTRTLFNDIDYDSTKKEAGLSLREFQTPETDINIVNKDSKSSKDVTERINALSSTKVKFEFQTGNNKQIKVSENALDKSKKLFAEDTISDKEKTSEGKNFKDPQSNKAFNINSILNTQVLNNFNEDLCTEDFKVLTSPNKRSGSPILLCPKAKKKKKFETPYKLSPRIVIDFNNEIKEVIKPVNLIKFKEDYKKNKKYSLQDLKNLEEEKTKNIDPYILNFNLENILSFEFDEARNDLKEGKMTIEEIKQLFTEATEKKLIPERWMDIHLKLIIWKLLSYEIKFPNNLGAICTVKNVIDQLKYRYDKELYNAERPILRKILEKDDVASKTMVLCVAGIYVDGVSVASVANLTDIELLLTDGWYFIKATIDNMLSKFVYDGKIVVGSKIVTCGAELLNCEQGVSPWEDTSAIRLSISGNSTRPAHWSAKLGLRPGVVLSRLPAVRTGGGKVARLRVRVTRVYPRLYVEKFQDGSTVTRSERLELQHQTKYEAEREAMIEKIYEEVEKEYFDQESQESDGALDENSKRNSFNSSSQIAKLMKKSKDPMEFKAQLTSTQIQLLQEHVSKQRDRYIQTIQDKVQERLRPRNVVTLARGRIVDVKRDGDMVTVTKGMLSIWKPNDEVLHIFKEGSWLDVTNVVPTAFRNSEIQLSAGRQSVFRPVKCVEEEIIKPHLESLKRTCHDIKDLSQNPSMTTDYNEIDTVGMIFSIEPPNQEFESIKNHFQNLYLTDIDKNIICVNFWGGIKKFGYENLLEIGQVIYCGNLQKRAGNTRKNIPQYRATEFSLFTKTPKNEKASKMVDEMNKKMFGLDRRKFCEDCVAVKQNYSVIKSLNDSENISPYRFNKSDYNLRRNKIFVDTPLGVKVDRKTDDLNLSGLDFESTFKQQDTQEFSPKTLFRKKKVSEKISKLKMYGEPPPLSSIIIVNKSINAANPYKSPLLLKSESIATPNKMSSNTNVNNLENVTTPKKIPDECVETDSDGKPNLDCSPTISMNRTYVKRSVNPVKLNFSGSDAIDKNNIIDHFAEEFDGSPPLSLD